MRMILSLTGCAILLFGFAAVGNDDGSCTAQTAPAAKKGAPQPQGKVSPSPLPTQVMWTGEGSLFIVLEIGAGRVTQIDAAGRRIAGTEFGLPRGFRGAFAAAPNRKFLAAFESRIPAAIIFDLNSRRSQAPVVFDLRDAKAIPIDPNPQALAVTPDSKSVLMACDSTGLYDRRVCICDVDTGVVKYRAIPGSSNLRGIAVDPTGKYALAAHLVHKSHLPSTQIEQGWVFTNSLTYLSLEGPEVTVTLPLDLRTQGFANPEGVAISPDGSKAYVAHAGADLVSVIDLPTLLEVVNDHVRDRRPPDGPSAGQHSPKGYQAEDLRLTRRYVRTRIPVGANPRGLAVSPDGKFVAVANRLDDSVSLIDAATDSVVAVISLYNERPPEGDDALIREGEKLFHSGKLSYSSQFSCASCHPDGHTDGLNWDLPADGFNNFHNTKSLLANAFTSPYGWLGTSPTLRDRFTGTLRHLFQHEPTESESKALEAYLVQLRYPGPAAEPDVAKQPAIQRGKALFEGAAGCRACHSGKKLTDRTLHEVGTGSDGQAAFDTPSLLGISTTAPYLHDGRAATLEEIFTQHNPQGLHGRAADLSAEQLADLIEYLKSL